MRIKLTPAFVAAASAESGAERTIFWDDDLPGFGLMVTANGARSFVVQYRANGDSRRMAIKATLRLGEARKEARAILGIVKGMARTKPADRARERILSDDEIRAIWAATEQSH